MSQSKPSLQIIVALLGCLGTIVAAVITGLFLLLSPNKVVIVPAAATVNVPPVSPTTEVIAIFPTEPSTAAAPLASFTPDLFSDAPAIPLPGELPQSDHPYANNYRNVWTISIPGVNQMRIHFSKLEIKYDLGDRLALLDQEDHELVTYDGGTDKPDGGWSEWWTGDTIKLRLATNETGTAYGFAVDNVETRNAAVPVSDLPESFHPYANNFSYTWTVSVPGASQIRIHFEKLEIQYDLGDSLKLLDRDDQKLFVYGGGNDLIDGGWTEWFTGDTLKLILTTNRSGTAYGLHVDQVETR